MRKSVLTHNKKQKALALLNSGQPSEALDLLAQICARTPADAEAWQVRGVACGSLNRHAEAAESFRKVIALQAGNAEAHYNLGIAERSLGFPDKAESAFRQAIQLNPQYSQAYESLAHGLIGRAAGEEAIQVLRAALQLRPDNAEWQSNLGSLLQAKGFLTDAEAHYRRALSLKPAAGFIYENLGSVLTAQGRMDEALGVYREGLRRDPRNARLHSNLLLMLNYIADQDPAEVLREHRAWEQTQAACAGKAVTKRGTHRGELFKIACQVARAGHIVPGTPGNQLRQPDGGQQAQANSAGMRLACQCYYGHAHPQCFAGRGGAVVRESVQGYIHPSIQREMFLRGRSVAKQFQPVRCDSVLPEHGYDPPLCCRVGQRRIF